MQDKPFKNQMPSTSLNHGPPTEKFPKFQRISNCILGRSQMFFLELEINGIGGAFDSAKYHKRQRRKRQSVTAKQEKSQTPKFVQVRLGLVRLS